MEQKTNLQRLIIAFITTEEASYKRFKEANKHHSVIMVNNDTPLHGLYFQTIINGDGFEDVGEDIRKGCQVRLVKDL